MANSRVSWKGWSPPPPPPPAPQGPFDHQGAWLLSSVKRGGKM